MTVTLFLVRHAAHDNVGGFLAGRADGIRLGSEGLAQAARLGERMKREAAGAIRTSPRTRTRQTASAIATACGLPEPEVTDALDEVDFGLWSGKNFDDLNADAQWRKWNTMRSLARTPGGECMLDVQRRVFTIVETLCNRHDKERIILVSHADVIKAAVIHVLGLSIDAWPKFDISPASITTMVAGDWGAKILTLNEITV
jgi:broad specificity phosphatase PhoE